MILEASFLLLFEIVLRSSKGMLAPPTFVMLEPAIASAVFVFSVSIDEFFLT